MLVFLLFVAISLGSVFGQFPRVCTTQEALDAGRCCPEVNGKLCNGHGDCRFPERLLSNNDSFLQAYDDRLDWPLSYYNKTCICTDNFSGYDCTQCKFGFYGENCNQTKTVTRKEIRNLTTIERKRFFSYLTLAKSTISKEYVIMVTGDRHHRNTYRFIDASVYDLFAWIHYFTVKPILVNSSFVSDRNFAHQGPAFTTWHRLLLLFVEREIQRLTGDEDFALPYYDWSHDNTCSICIDDFIGGNDMEGNINKHSHFASWKAICSGYNYADAYCRSAATNQLETLLRKPGRDPLTRIPSADDVAATLRFPNFDNPPYDRNANWSFRNALEGFKNVHDQMAPDENMHNMFHDYIGGTMSQVAISANDPIFFLHHNFIDKILETWITGRNQSFIIYPANDHPGQNSIDCAMPFIPCYRHENLLRASKEFGYNFS